jgi:hypothetical protein
MPPWDSWAGILATREQEGTQVDKGAIALLDHFK